MKVSNGVDTKTKAKRETTDWKGRTGTTQNNPTIGNDAEDVFNGSGEDYYLSAENFENPNFP